ncbi:hypothetical protein D9611_006206 [Ephemerocybe angulata]|uniref:Nephrocystin 3-like N-terminal domain-containing protein n=1 Tax=Ephemerocybe angulata TaxID=980116 RepID=A0A8H5C6I0_9AGAR|nr:hypothetical protein D9611_006206 [Tulosesus angulatus]
MSDGRQNTSLLTPDPSAIFDNTSSSTRTQSYYKDSTITFVNFHSGGPLDLERVVDRKVAPSPTEEPVVARSLGNAKGKAELKLKSSLSIWAARIKRQFRRGKLAEGPRVADHRGQGGSNYDNDDNSDKPNDSKWEVSLLEEAKVPRRSPSSAGTYVRNMVAFGEGFPCWHPVPLPGHGIVPGDVGIIREQYDFQRLFNIWEKEDSELRVVTPPDATSTARSIPFPSWEAPNRDELSVPPVQRFAAGKTLVKGASVRMDFTNSLNTPSFHFHCPNAEGSVLGLTSSAELDTLSDTSPLKAFLTHNAGALFGHARALKPFLPKQPLYVITGAVKARSWAMAAYSEPMLPGYDKLELVPIAAATHGSRDAGWAGGEAMRYVWTSSGSADARCDERMLSLGDGGEGRKNDTCLFLKGFKVAASDASWDALSGPGTGPDGRRGPEGGSGRGDSKGKGPERGGWHGSAPQPPGEGGSGGNRDAQGGTDGGVGGGAPREEDGREPPPEGSRGGEGSQYVGGSSKLQDSSMGVQSFPYPDDLELYHPSDYINEVLLEKTGSNFALTHDDDWRNLVVSDGLSTGGSLFVSFSSIDLLEVTTKNGVSSLASDRGGLEHTQGERLSYPNQAEEVQEPEALDTGILMLRRHSYQSKEAGSSNRPAAPGTYHHYNGPVKLTQHNVEPATNEMFGGKSVGNLSQHAPRGHTERKAIDEGEALRYLMQNIAPGAIHDSRERCDAPKCMPETRVAVQEDIMSWIEAGDQEAQKIMWVTGPAGTGKTAILGTISDTCKEKGTLAASFFFSAFSGSANRRTKRYFVPTLAFQIMGQGGLEGTLEHVLSSVARDQGTIFTKNLKEQFVAMVLNPLLSTAQGPGSGAKAAPRLIIIDALDECDIVQNDPADPAHARAQAPVGRKEDDQREILSLLLFAASNPSFPFRILVASRPEVTIRDFFATDGKACTRELFLDQKYDPDADIALFYDAKFSTICRRLGIRPEEWPGEGVKYILVRNASGQFIYAATVVRYIEGSPHSLSPQSQSSNKPSTPHRRLQHILGQQQTGSGQNPLEALDALYRLLLETCPDPELSMKWLGAAQLKVNASRRDHFPVWLLQLVLEASPGEEQYALGPLSSLLPTQISEENLRKPYSFYHKTFLDFLADATRCGKRFLTEDEALTWVAQRFFQTLDKHVEGVARQSDQRSYRGLLIILNELPRSSFQTVVPYILSSDLQQWAAACAEQHQNPDMYMNDPSFPWLLLAIRMLDVLHRGCSRYICRSSCRLSTKKVTDVLKAKGWGIPNFFQVFRRDWEGGPRYRDLRPPPRDNQRNLDSSSIYAFAREVGNVGEKSVDSRSPSSLARPAADLADGAKLKPAQDCVVGDIVPLMPDARIYTLPA